MLRAIAVASLLTTTAVDTAPPDPQAMTLETGHILCVGYDAETHSCVTKTSISRSNAEGTVVLEEMLLTDFGAALRLTTLMTYRSEGALYCLAPDSVRAVVMPELHPAAPAVMAATVAGLGNYARAGYCLAYRECDGGGHAALAYFNGMRFAEEDLAYTLFRSDDPKADALSTRAASIKDLDALKGFAPVTCLPPR